MTSIEPKSSLEERFQNIGKKEEPESWSDYFSRLYAQHSARGAELFLGLPAGLKKEAQKSKEYFESFLPEDVVKSMHQMEEKQKPEKDSIQDVLYNPPTSAEIREKGTKKVAKEQFGNADYLEPKTLGEAATMDFVQDLESMFMPGTGSFRMLTRIGAPIVGHTLKHGSKYLGASEETAEKIKSGFMLATTLAAQSQPGKFAGKRIAEGKSLVPQGTTSNANVLARNLVPLIQRLRKGLRTPSKSKSLDAMEELAGKIQNGRINTHELMQARDDINEWISDAGGFDVPKDIRDKTVKNLNELKSGIIETIDDTLKTRFPEAYDLYKTGYEASAVVHQSNAISNFIEHNFGKQAKSIGLKLLFPSAVGGAAFLPKTMTAAGATIPFYQAGKVIYRVSQSPTLAKYYADVIEASLRGNVGQMTKSLSKLDDELYKEESKRKKTHKMSIEEFKSNFKRND